MGKSFIQVPTNVLKERRVFCHLCNEAHTCISNLHVHILEKHNTTAFYPCKECKKSYVSKLKLSLHKKRVHGECKKCLFCEYKTPRTDTLRNHMRIHSKKEKMKIYKQSQTYYLARKVKKDIINKITSSSYLYRTINWNEVLKKSEGDNSEHFSNL